MTTLTHITYGTRVTFNHPRWCAVCGTQRATERINGVARFVPHAKPNGKPCDNSGKPVSKQEQAG